MTAAPDLISKYVTDQFWSWLPARVSVCRWFWGLNDHGMARYIGGVALDADGELVDTLEDWADAGAELVGQVMPEARRYRTPERYITAFLRTQMNDGEAFAFTWTRNLPSAEATETLPAEPDDLDELDRFEAELEAGEFDHIPEGFYPMTVSPATMTKAQMYTRAALKIGGAALTSLVGGLSAHLTMPLLALMPLSVAVAAAIAFQDQSITKSADPVVAETTTDHSAN